jgi:hypothetical protein
MGTESEKGVIPSGRFFRVSYQEERMTGTSTTGAGAAPRRNRKDARMFARVLRLADTAKAIVCPPCAALFL